MPLASNARIGWQNRADEAGISASSFVIDTPPAILQNPHVARKWRGVAGEAEYLTFDLGAQRSIDCVALMGLNLTEAGLTRIRASTGDSSGQHGDAHDSDPAGASAGRVNPRYPSLIHLLPAPVTARYVRIDLAEPGAPYIEAGRAFIGLAEQVTYNFAFGWQRGFADRSRTTKSRGGQTYIDRDNGYRTLDLTFEAITQEQRYGLFEDVDQFNGKRTDILFVTDPTSGELGRDAIWGLVSEMTPIGQPHHRTYSKTFRIEERL
ncbi:MAG TPA: discoidin domain-containing protein [Bosea sp. (in: a-proteobacteria)]|jgi:hypothetical protein|uniref:discoidin domain-containing protein n=1 Tax=Bosea sp. (in: a-proteobacteria) TaxID=1871050 RepID=UPI002E13630B|nr:discoidin domain-containing protein [Bosea sp. (in: a-proteobacteria)]